MRKLETPEKLAARKAKEQKELEKWRKEQQKPKHKFYLLYLLVVLSLVFIMDSIATGEDQTALTMSLTPRLMIRDSVAPPHEKAR